MSGATDSGWIRPMAAAVVAQVAAALPLLLLGTLTVFITEDVPYSETRLGIAVAVFFVVSSAAAVPMGRLVDRLGSRRALGLGVGINVVVMVGFGGVVTRWWQIAVLMAASGVATSLIISGTGRSLVLTIPARRQGLAFGVRQTALPVGSIAVGLALPFVGTGIGWRAGFLFAAALVGVGFVALARGSRPERSIPGSAGALRAPTRSMALLGVTVAFGSAAASSTLGFYVPSGVARGLDPAVVGLLLAMGSGVGLTARVSWGWLADRRQGGNLVFVSWLLVVGSLGFGLLGIVDTLVPTAVATIVVFGSGWSWTGLTALVAARGSPGAPGSASGIVLLGTGIGGFAGPLLFGAIVDIFDYRAAWLFAAGCMLMAAIFARTTRRVWRAAIHATHDG